MTVFTCRMLGGNVLKTRMITADDYNEDNYEITTINLRTCFYFIFLRKFTSILHKYNM